MFVNSKDIGLEKLVPFKDVQEQTFEEDWIQQLADCIKRAGLLNPVTVRPANNGKYEVICGQNRVKALEMLGCKIIHADIMYGLSDEDAAELFLNSSLTQQPFWACSYSKRFEIVKHCEVIINRNSRQGKRTDIEEKSDVNKKVTYVQPVSNSDKTKNTYVQLISNYSGNSRRLTTRDSIAQQLGISTASLSKYRRIIKLPDDLLQSIADLLDEKRITFEAAYIISNVIDIDIRFLIKELNKHPDWELDLDKLKELPKRNVRKSNDIFYPISNVRVLEVFKPPLSPK